tara:strand:+ start:14173 stop:14682 length:510 start_codon:yes stop_codon:yes gene_type:complete
MLIAWYCFFGYKYSFVYIWGKSMEPTHMHREVIVVERVKTLGKFWKPAKLDAVVIEDKKENEALVKRVIGLAGDKIKIKDGYVYLNGKKFEDPYSRGRIGVLLVDSDNQPLRYWETGHWGNAGDPVIQYVTTADEITVPEGHVWVIGDNRVESWYGALPVKDIKALVIF